MQGFFSLQCYHLLTNIVFGCLGCNGQLGMKDGRIMDYQLTSSSAYGKTFPARARYSLEGDAWCASKYDLKQYIQVSS